VYDLYNATEFDETSPLCPDPKNPYQATKTEAERAVWAASAEGLPVLVIRPCNVLAATPNSYWGEAWLKRVADGFNRWHPDGRFPWIHVENLVDLTLLAVRTPQAVGQAYTAVDGQVPNSEYWGRLAQWVGNTRAPEGVPGGWQFHTEKIQALGYQPRVSFAEAMAEIEAFAQAHGYMREEGCR
jgi:nucleoside-diphosphate-sugar epimerase